MLACRAPEDLRPAGEAGWLIGTTHEKLDTIAKHLRGFDMAMVEAGYRYNVLYFAGRDENWELADYQAQKIQLTMKLGFERRPKREASAQEFLSTALPKLREAIAERDSALFADRFTALTTSCNACHVAEKMGFVNVVTPTTRLAPLGPAGESRSTAPAPDGGK